MNGRLYIHAPNIHQGGGRTLLVALLRALQGNFRVSTSAHLDLRMDVDGLINSSVAVKPVKPNIFDRIKSEILLASQVGEDDVVLCLGNLPPLFPLKGKVFVFLQNRYLVEKKSLEGFSLKERLRLSIERLWLAWRAKVHYTFVVQSLTMEKLVRKCLRIKPLVLPFVEVVSGFQRRLNTSSSQDKKFDFIYVASAEPHKNHRRLLDCWVILANENIFPRLCLTLSEGNSSELLNWIETQKNKHGLLIENIYVSAHEDIKNLYNQCGALIYPSLLESFGLPLVEARRYGLPIVAAELDYVRDLVDPEETFDPTSPTSISRAVKRFMGIAEPPPPLVDAKLFLEKLQESITKS